MYDLHCEVTFLSYRPAGRLTQLLEISTIIDNKLISLQISQLIYSEGTHDHTWLPIALSTLEVDQLFTSRSTRRVYRVDAEHLTCFLLLSYALSNAILQFTGAQTGEFNLLIDHLIQIIWPHLQLTTPYVYVSTTDHQAGRSCSQLQRPVVMSR